MLGNKVLPDETRAGEENRAHIHKAGRYQQMTPRSADGSVAGGAIIDPNCVPGREQPPGILGAPINPDPHSHGRHSHESTAVKPPERPGAHYAEENRRRIYGRGVKYR
jgi:hypothetical protein